MKYIHVYHVEYIERGSELYTIEDISTFVLTQRNDVRALFGAYTYVRALFGVYTYVRALFGVYTYVRALFRSIYVRALFGVYTCISHGVHREREPKLNATEDLSG